MEELRNRKGDRKYTFEKTLAAIERLASRQTRPRLLQTDEERRAKPTIIGTEPGERLRVVEGSVVTRAKQEQGAVRGEIGVLLGELRSAASSELKPVRETTTSMPSTAAFIQW